MAKSDLDTATPRPYITGPCSLSAISPPYGSWVQPRPGGTTSPWAFMAMVGPPLPKVLRTSRLVALIMPAARTLSSGTLCASTWKPSPSSSALARLPWASQSPGGLSDGTLTSSARKASCCGRRASMVCVSVVSMGFMLSRAVMFWLWIRICSIDGLGALRGTAGAYCCRWKCSTKSANTRAAVCASSGVMVSVG
ncbi:hypothetical protein D3C86_1223920 [compost metagenome]